MQEKKIKLLRASDTLVVWQSYFPSSKRKVSREEDQALRLLATSLCKWAHPYMYSLTLNYSLDLGNAISSFDPRSLARAYMPLKDEFPDLHCTCRSHHNPKKAMEFEYHL